MVNPVMSSVYRSIAQSCPKTDEEYDQALVFVQTGEFPPSKVNNPMQRSRYRRSMSHYSVSDHDGQQRLVVITDEVPPSLRNKQGELLTSTIERPFRLVVVRPSEKQRILSSQWGRPEAGGFRSARAFHRKLSTQLVGISLSDVEAFVKTQDVHAVQAPVQTRVVVQPIVVPKAYDLWQIDLVDMSRLAPQNKNTHFLLVCVDAHSKLAWVRPLRNKTAAEVARELESIIYAEGVAPKTVLSDNGGEFKGEVLNLYERFNIEARYTRSHNPATNGGCERLNKTLKEAIYRHLRQYETKRYIDVLQSLVYSYNTTVHSTTNVAPVLAHRGHYRLPNLLSTHVHDNISKAADKTRPDPALTVPLEVGDRVRLAAVALSEVRALGPFRKHHAVPNWSKEIYVVAEVRETTPDLRQYRITDEQGGLVEGGLFVNRHHLRRVDVVEEEKYADDDEVVQHSAVAELTFDDDVHNSDDDVLQPRRRSNRANLGVPPAILGVQQ